MKVNNEHLPYKKIMVVGDIMLDKYVLGRLKKVSLEVSSPVLNVTSTDFRLGGAANVAANIRSLGAHPVIVSVIGQDSTSVILNDLFNTKNIDHSYLTRDATRTSSLKTRLFDGTVQILRYDSETKEDISYATEFRMLRNFVAAINNENPEIVLLQDYNKGILTKRVIREVLKICNRAKLPVVVDPKKDNFFEYQNVTLFKPNLSEFCCALDYTIKPTDVSKLTTAAEELQRRNGFKNLMVTLGAHGIFIYNSQLKGRIVPLKEKIRVIDVSGAGDTVISIAAMAFSNGFDMIDIANMCNRGASKVCAEFGVSTVKPKDLRITLTTL